MLAQPHDPGLVNPLDLGLRATADDFERITAALAADPDVDAVLVLYAPSLGANPAEVRHALDAGHGSRPEVPVAACFYGPDRAEDGTDGRSRVPVYDAIDAAAQSLGRVAAYAEWLSLPEGDATALDPDGAARARSVVQAAVARRAPELDAIETAAVLTDVGLTQTATFAVASGDEAADAAMNLGYPVVLKAVHRDALAKTAADGFALDLADEQALRAAWQRMEASLGASLLPAVVQPMVERGVDVAICVDDHPQVGPVVSLGPGGASAALDQGVDVRVLPLTDLDARRLVEASRLAPLLGADSRRALEEALLRIGALVEEIPEITAVRANPVIVVDTGAVLTDVTLTVEPLDPDPRPPLQRP